MEDGRFEAVLRLLEGTKEHFKGEKDMWKKIVLGILLFISAVTGFGVAKVESTMNHTLNHVTRDENSALSKVDLSGIEVESDDEIVNILLVGDDFRKEEGYTASGLPDVMMVATMDKKHNTLKLSSLMRDTLVNVTEAEELKKLNASCAYGGIKNLYKTIAKNFNVKLDGYVKVGFDAFEKVVNAVGGVEVELTDTEVRYLNSTNYIRKKKNRKVKVGKHRLNGDQALAYCRIRKGKDIIGEPVVTANGLMDDYGRTWRQRTVISAAFNEMKELPLTEWIDIANKVLSSVETDLGNDAILTYIKDVVVMGTTDIYQLQIPRNGYFREGNKGITEFPDCQGECLVPTNGETSDFDTSENAKILRQFIFKYDGKEEFTYPSEETAK